LVLEIGGRLNLFFVKERMPVVESAKSSTNAVKAEFKTPTAEEMSQLRETSELFKSNLFKLQVLCILIVAG
jgi:hypothetical protein